MHHWNTKEFQDALRAFRPHDVDFVRVSFYLEGLAEEELEALKISFRDFLLDDSMTFKEKAEEFLDICWPSGRTFDYLEKCWELIAPHEPNPLAGHPRPTDESLIRKYTFRPHDD